MNCPWCARDRLLLLLPQLGWMDLALALGWGCEREVRHECVWPKVVIQASWMVIEGTGILASWAAGVPHEVMTVVVVVVRSENANVHKHLNEKLQNQKEGSIR